MTILEVNGKRVEVGEGFKDLSPDEQNRVVEEIAQSMGGPAEKPSGPDFPIMSQVNRGIADTAGGFVDFINPFDQPHALNPFPQGTGSAKTGLQSAMRSGGIDVAEGAPDTMSDAFFRGTGEAIGALPAVASGTAALSRAPGMVGNIASDATASLASRGGMLAEMLAGGLSGSGRQLAKDAGAPQWAQETAAIAAPMSIPAGITAATGVARRTPVGVMARQLGGNVKAATMPYTKSGATEVASRRAVQLAGGPDRAAELRDRITPDNPLNLTPAQQTRDPNMLAIEQLAASGDGSGAALRSRLDERAQASRQTAVDDLTVQGDIGDTRAFFETRRREFADNLRAQADDAIKRAQQGIQNVGPARTEEENALAVSQRIKSALEDAKAQEKTLWSAVDKDQTVGTSEVQSKLAEWRADFGRVGEDDIPPVARQWLDDEFGDVESVRDMHTLYSKLRQTARNERAGNKTNPRMAVVADQLADAILKDLGAVGGATQVGRQINEARAFSAALHETFDQGEVGRLLKKTLDGDMSVAPELGLQRSVARPGVAGAVAARDIETAAPGSERFIRDFIKGQFQDAAISPTGEFTRKSAAAFLRKNGPLLERYPELRKDIADAAKERISADDFAARLETRLSSLRDAKLSAGAAILNGPPSQAINALKNARNPVRAARLLRNEAAKDDTGQALAGLKSLLSAELIRKPTGDGISATLNDPKLKAAFSNIFTPAEISRMRKMGRELEKLDLSQEAAPSIGTSLSGASPPKLIEFAARIIAARQGADLGGGGGASIQTASMASDRVKNILGRLTADRASQMLADAVEDPELFRLLLSDVRQPATEAKAISRALPYLVGGMSTTDQE